MKVQPSDAATMHPFTDLNAPRRPALVPPRPAFEWPAETAAVISDGTQPIGEMLAGLLNDESTLYAITREWRYDPAGRTFLRLQALLDEQFSEIGVRLTRLAARSRELGGGKSAGHGDRAARPRAAGGVLPATVLRELLGLHEAMIAALKRGSAVAGGQFHDSETNDLLADLTANHEKDAFMLRALLWEVQNTAA